MRYLIVILMLVLPGCGRQAPEALFLDYVQRLANVTAIEPLAGAPVPLPPYPRGREMVLEANDVRVGIVDFFELGQCGLLGKVSERNSPLGRLQRESGRLLYELDVYRTLTECAGRLQQASASDREFRAKLASLLEAKQRVLPVAFWNATFAAREFQFFFDSATPPLQKDEAPVISAFERPLKFFASLGSQLENAPRIQPEDFERHYFELQSAKTGGKVLRALSIAEFHLNRAAAVLEQAAEAGRTCPMGRKTTQAEYLFNVFVKFYAGGVQPYVGRLHRTAEPLAEAVAALHRVQKVAIPAAFASFYTTALDPGDQQSLWRRFDSALKRHTKAWQTVLKPCGMLPSAPLGASSSGVG